MGPDMPSLSLQFQSMFTLLAQDTNDFIQVGRRCNLHDRLVHPLPKAKLPSGFKHQCITGWLPHDRAASSKSVMSSKFLAVAVIRGPISLVVQFFWVCCPSFWESYLGLVSRVIPDV